MSIHTAPRTVLTLVTARRPGGPGISPHNHLTVNGNLLTTLCGLQVRTPINHIGDTQKLADCQNCQRSLKAVSPGKPPRDRRSACRGCDDVYGLDATDRCRSFIATSDSDGHLFCVRCGHTEQVHP